ncbi:hypothetical protein SHIRM173S_05556 [Streptomyces hirsutus]
MRGSADELLASVDAGEVAPVSAVLVMMCTASAATSSGTTTRPMGSAARSPSRRASSASPSRRADNGVSTKPAAIRFTRTGASSSARLAVNAGIAAVTAGATPGAARIRRAPVPPRSSSVPPGRTAPAQWRATSSASTMWSLIARRDCSASMSRRRP